MIYFLEPKYKVILNSYHRSQLPKLGGLRRESWCLILIYSKLGMVGVFQTMEPLEYAETPN